ncbi:DNA-directed RNA polymerase subunit D [Methanohalophilus levihalophilus]|nr:DNA-directed RNA polymerase subunit D [Methanohalophilus levihalophilus]
MEVDLLELSDRSARFILSGVDASFANGLRRAMLADVPTLAIEEVGIYNNTSVLYDEQIGLRMALIPIATNFEEFVPHTECSCEDGCPACSVAFTLSVEAEDEERMVYSGDLVSSDPKVSPADSSIPIVLLKPGQKLVLEATATMGFGHDHARWQAGVACGYKNMPVIDIHDCDRCGACVTVCPRDILVLGEESAEVVEDGTLRCSLCKLCVGSCDIDAIDVTEDVNSFIFTMESDGSYSAQQLIINAVSTIKEKASSLDMILGEL